jgi:hypothetical protein
MSEPVKPRCGECGRESEGKDGYHDCPLHPNACTVIGDSDVSIERAYQVEQAYLGRNEP